MELPSTLSHAYLITGGSEEQRHALAKQMAQAYLCDGAPTPCGECRHCRKVEADIHPDVQWIHPQIGKQGISVDQVRMLRSDLYVKPNEGARKVYVIEPADALNDNAQNALLKSLEDGPAYGAFLLLTQEPGQLLGTVHSRCETLTLPPKEEEPDPQQLEQAVQLADLLLTGSELQVVQELTALELSKIKGIQLDQLLALIQRCVAQQLTQYPARGVRLLQILRECRANMVYYPSPGHVLGWLCARLFAPV